MADEAVEQAAEQVAEPPKHHPHAHRPPVPGPARSSVSPDVDLATGQRDEEPGLAARNTAYEKIAAQYAEDGQDEAAKRWRDRVSDPSHLTPKEG